MKSLKCTVKGCNYRHPKTCKWFSKEVGCRRNYCEFRHSTFAKSDDKISAHKESSFKCEGCINLVTLTSVKRQQSLESTNAVAFRYFCL